MSSSTSLILAGGGVYGDTTIVGTNLDSVDLTRGVIVRTLPTLFTRSAPTPSATSTFLKFHNTTTRELVGEISILAYDDGTNSIKFIKGPGDGSSAPIKVNAVEGASTFTWTEDGLNIDAAVDLTPSSTCLYLKYKLNEYDFIELRPIQDSGSLLEVIVSRGNISTTDPSTGDPITVEITQRVRIDSSELATLFVGETSGASLEVTVTSSGNVDVFQYDADGVEVSPPTVVHAKNVTLRDCQEFVLIPGVIETVYIANEAVTLPKLSSDVQVLVTSGGAGGVTSDYVNNRFVSSDYADTNFARTTYVNGTFVNSDYADTNFARKSTVLFNNTDVVLSADLYVSGQATAGQIDGGSLGGATIVSLSKNNVLFSLVSDTTVTFAGYATGQTGNILLNNASGADHTVQFGNALHYLAGSDQIFTVPASTRGLISYYAPSSDVYISYINRFIAGV